jgi:hypothetical protein
MRAVTKAAFVDATRAFLDAWNGDVTVDHEAWQVVAAAMEHAWELHEEDIANAAGGTFNGPYYDPATDDERLQRQLGRVWQAMSDGQPHTLPYLCRQTGDPHASVSAQLRHLRKRRFGSWIIDVTRAGGIEGDEGLFVYTMRNPDGTPLPPVRPGTYIPPGGQA